jgi:L-amino acid N-acyltransferase YncA
MNIKVNDPNAFGFVAEHEGKLLGSIFLNVFPSTPVAAIGPFTVDPDAEGTGAGRLLINRAIEEARGKGIPQLRLVQSPSHLRSLALYTKVGFEVREPLVLVQRGPANARLQKAVRKADVDDIANCESLCRRVHGFARSAEIRAAVKQGVATVALREGEVKGYATDIGFRGHAAAEASADLKALVAASPSIMGPGFFVPLRDGELFRWLLDNGYRAVWQAILMSCGPYQHPAGVFLPSIAF